MKFQQLSAFEKHLEKAAPDHLSRVYLVAAPCSFERKRISETISAAIRHKEKKTCVLSFDAASGWAAAIEELRTICSLSGPGFRIVVLNEADKLKKSALDVLSAYVSKPSSHVYLILSAASAKPFAELYERGKKELVVCDLSAEKPWERKERLKAQLVKMAALEKKDADARGSRYAHGADRAGICPARTGDAQAAVLLFGATADHRSGRAYPVPFGKERIGMEPGRSDRLAGEGCQCGRSV